MTNGVYALAYYFYDRAVKKKDESKDEFQFSSSVI